jgi:hypothetical protein
MREKHREKRGWGGAAGKDEREGERSLGLGFFFLYPF